MTRSVECWAQKAGTILLSYAFLVSLVEQEDMMMVLSMVLGTYFGSILMISARITAVLRIVMVYSGSSDTEVSKERALEKAV